MGEKLLQEGEKVLEEIELLQSTIFIEFQDEYAKSYIRFQKNIFLLPEDVMYAALSYYEHLSDLFENQNDSDLGVKLLSTLDYKVFELQNQIRQHIGIDNISQANMKILSAGRQQLKFEGEE